MENQTVEEGKTNAIISYLWIPGLIIGYILNNSKKNPFTNFHIRQSLGLCIASLISTMLINRFSSIASWIIDVVLFVLWIIAFIGVINGEEKKAPIVGDQFQEWFKGV